MEDTLHERRLEVPNINVQIQKYCFSLMNFISFAENVPSVCLSDRGSRVDQAGLQLGSEAGCQLGRGCPLLQTPLLSTEVTVCICPCEASTLPTPMNAKPSNLPLLPDLRSWPFRPFRCQLTLSATPPPIPSHAHSTPFSAPNTSCNVYVTLNRACLPQKKISKGEGPA